MRLKKYALTFKIAKTLIAVLTITIIIQSMYVLYFMSKQDNKLEEAGDVVLKTIEVTFDGIIERLNISANKFAFYEDVGNFVNADSSEERFILYEDIFEVVDILTSYNSEISNIYILNKDEVIFNFYGTSNSQIVRNFSKYIKDSTNIVFDSTYKYGEINNLIYTTPIYTYTPEEALYYKSTGDLLLAIDMNKFRNSMEDEKALKNVKIEIEDKEGSTIELGVRDIDKSKYKKIFTERNKYGLKITLYLPEDYVAVEFGVLNWIIITITIFIFLILIIGVYIYTDITKPIDDLIYQLKELHSNGRKKEIAIHRGDEIKNISMEINDLLNLNAIKTKKIIETQRKLYETEILHKENKLYMLQMQINPHFLYNTLACIKSLGIIHGVKDVVTVSAAMSTILRYSIKGNALVSIEEELEFIDDYVKIIDLRFENKYKFNFNISCDKKIKTIKMILQPLIENAIEHGFDNSINGGEITINIYVENNKLYIEVIDNGNNFPLDKLEEINIKLNDGKDYSKDSIGLMNVHKRVQSYFGNEYGVRISTGSNTIITVVQSVSNNIY
ncbi:MAG: sensor histidine kinase [Lachnospirales bacterium]